MTALLKYDAACRAIAEAKTVDEVTTWIDKAAAIREYGRRIEDRTMELDAIEIRVIAKRRRGELLIAMKDAGHLAQGRKTSPANDMITLEALGVTRNESSQDQKLAAIPQDSFERLKARCRAYAEGHPEKHSFEILQESGREAINGARAIMGSRQEPDDSLDYFPTPPWATRALFERVFPQFGFRGDCDRCKSRSVWEPACGEGHIAEVLSEYFGKVYPTDIFDYGYGGVVDFLDPDADAGADWIITNPPFGDVGEAFVLKALQSAQIGVAMFVRLQWLETIGRYENVFRDCPPTLIAFFAERVNLCKGRWDPDGGTATAYIWLIWIKGEAPRAPFWIPPGCREQLSRPDDIARFTAHPVIRHAWGNESKGEDDGKNDDGLQHSERQSADGGELQRPGCVDTHGMALGRSRADVAIDVPDFLGRPQAPITGNSLSDYGDLNPVAKATEGKAGMAEVKDLVRGITAGTGLQVGEADADQPATSENLDVTDRRDGHLNSVSDGVVYSSLPSGESEPMVTLA